MLRSSIFSITILTKAGTGTFHSVLVCRICQSNSSPQASKWQHCRNVYLFVYILSRFVYVLFTDGPYTWHRLFFPCTGISGNSSVKNREKGGTTNPVLQRRYALPTVSRAERRKKALRMKCSCFIYLAAMCSAFP